MTLRCRAVTCVVSGLLVGPMVSTTGAERLPLQNFTVRDGLPSDTINCIERDPAGFIWICSAEGLTVYDGFVFRTFGVADGLPHRRVTELLPARDGTYWVGTDGGLARFRPTGRAPGQPRFTVLYPPAPTNWTPDVVIANSISALFEDRSGRIWVGTAQAGLFTVEGRGTDLTLELVDIDLPIDTWVNALAESGDGTMWVGTSKGLFHYSPETAVPALEYRTRLVNAPGVANQDILSLLLQRSKLFVGTRNAGLQLLDLQPRPGHASVERSWQTPDAQGGDRVVGLIAASDGHLWYAGAGGAREVSLEVASGRSLRTWGAGAGLGASNVSAVAEDPGGNMWIGTDGGGIFRLRRGGFTTFTVDDGLAGDQVKDLFLAQGALHVVTAKVDGLFLNRFDGVGFRSTSTPYTRDPLHNRLKQLAMYDRRGSWWLATQTGVIRAEAPSLEALPTSPAGRYGLKDGLWSDAAYKVFEDSRGDVWIGTFLALHNLTRWRRDSGRFERHEVRTFPYGEGFGFGFVPEVFAEAPAGVVWVGSFYGGVARYMEGRWDYLDVEDGVPEGRILAMLSDRKGRLWIGSSNGGLARVDRPAAPRPTFAYVRKSDGLSSNYVLTLAEDLEGHIYVGGGLGLDRLNPETREVRRFGVEDGLPGGRIVAAFRDPLGDLWFGTNQGLTRFRPSALDEPEWPELRVLRVSAPDVEVGLSDLGEVRVPDLLLQPRQNTVEITVGALASGPMPGVRFEGRLEGTASGWIPIEPGRPVALLDLQPGEYRFVARAVTASGRSGPSSVSVGFTILRPWWARPWAVGLWALLALGGLAFAYQLRVRHLLAIERVRSRLASDLHDDIGANLSRMALLSEVAQRAHGDARQQAAVGALAEIAAAARSLADEVADVVWSTDPRHDTVANVIGRASSFGADLFQLRGTEWRCSVADDAAARRVAPDVKRHLLLLIKEALNNIAKHAGAGAASLEVRVDKGDLVVEVSDDGRGFTAEVAQPNGAPGSHGGNGLANMEERARLMGGRVAVRSVAGQGCRIELRVPATTPSRDWRRLLGALSWRRGGRSAG